MLSYSLQDNLLTPAPGDYHALPVNFRVYLPGEVTQRILAKNPGMGLSQINAVIELFIDEVCSIVEDGGAVNTPLFNTQPSIAGTFNGAADSFDGKRHRVKTNLTAGTRLQKATAGIKTQKVQTAEPLPYILEVQDVLSNTVNEMLTPAVCCKFAADASNSPPKTPTTVFS
jgi:hypothetical protein